MCFSCHTKENYLRIHRTHLFVASLYYTKELDPESTIDHLRNLKITPPSPPKTLKDYGTLKSSMIPVVDGHKQNTNLKKFTRFVSLGPLIFSTWTNLQKKDQGLRRQLPQPLLSCFRPILGTRTHEESCHQWLSSCTKLGKICWGTNSVGFLLENPSYGATSTESRSLIGHKQDVSLSARAVSLSI